MSNQNAVVSEVNEFDFIGISAEVARGAIEAGMWGHDRLAKPKTSELATGSVDTTDAEIAALINKPTPTELLMRNIVDWASEVGIIPNWVAAIIPDDVYLSIGNTIEKLVLEKVGEHGQLPITPEILLAKLGELKDTDMLSSALKGGFDRGFNFGESLSRKMATSNTNAAEDIAEAISDAISEPQPAGVKIVTMSAKGKNKSKPT